MNSNDGKYVFRSHNGGIHVVSYVNNSLSSASEVRFVYDETSNVKYIQTFKVIDHGENGGLRDSTLISQHFILSPDGLFKTSKDTRKLGFNVTPTFTFTGRILYAHKDPSELNEEIKLLSLYFQRCISDFTKVEENELAITEAEFENIFDGSSNLKAELLPQEPRALNYDTEIMMMPTKLKEFIENNLK